MQRRNALIASPLRSATGPFCGSRGVHQSSGRTAGMIAEVVKPVGLVSTRNSRLTGPHTFQRIDGRCAVPRSSGGHAAATLLERF